MKSKSNKNISLCLCLQAGKHLLAEQGHQVAKAMCQASDTAERFSTSVIDKANGYCARLLRMKALPMAVKRPSIDVTTDEGEDFEEGREVSVAGHTTTEDEEGFGWLMSQKQPANLQSPTMKT